MSTYGRSRQSIADLEQELHDIFESHPQSHINESGEPAIPADKLVDVFRVFGENHAGVQLITDEEVKQLNMLVESNPGLEVTPQILLQFIAMRTTHSPTRDATTEPNDRGRLSDREEQHEFSSRSSSRESNGTSYGMKGPPKTPLTARTPISANTPDSPFDNGRRQRSTPLTTGAPSSWSAKRPPPAYRRKSDAGASGPPGMSSRTLSDSEAVSSHRRHGSRSRAPSNPTSPRGTNSQPELPWNGASPPYIGSPPMRGSSISRPHSRTQSHGQYNMPGVHYPQPDFERSFDSDISLDHVDSSFDYPSQQHGDELESSLSSLTMPRNSSDSDSESDGEDPTLGLVMDRSVASSLASLEPQDRLDALQRVNAELGRKLIDAERTLQKKLSEHESDLEDMQSRLEEAKSELTATKREEKELRAKERQNSNQIAALESEIAKMQKSLDTARISYQSLQKQYQEQCTESERYRNSLRRRDEEIKDHQDQISLHAVEIQKWQQQREQSEAHAANLEEQLAIAREAQAQLDEQKQENLMLKETIDRMRFDMDELRTKADMAAGGSGSSGTASAQGSISKSLGLEIMRMNNGKWIGEEDDEDVDDDVTAVEEEADGDETEGEDVIQTIITRKKRKVAGRANKMETIHVEDIKEYSDAYTQYDMSEFTTSHTIQTDPEPQRQTSTFSVQTEELAVDTSAIQTEPEVLPTQPERKEMEIQTDAPEQERSASPSDEDLGSSLESSSSTLRPPTPKPQKGELPPSYSQVARTGEDGEPSDGDEDDLPTRRDMRVAAQTLQKWHKGMHVPLAPVVGGVSDDAREEWAALKDEIGFECLAIDRVLELSEQTGQPRTSGKRLRKSGRFYNIYNTVVYRNGEDGTPGSGPALVQTVLLALGLSAIGIAVLTPYTAPQYAVPGGPTYYDRAAWSSFNAMSGAGEGFSPDGTAAVWNFIGRVGGGAARIAAGWPS